MTTTSVGLEAEADVRDPEASASQTSSPDYFASLRLVGRFMEGAQLKLGATVAIATFAVACELVPVWAVYRLVCEIIAGSLAWSSVLGYAAASLLAVLLGFAAMGFALALSHIVAFDAIYRLRLGVARHMARLPLGYFADRPSGDAKKLVIDEPEKLELIVAHGVPEGVSALATWLAVSIWLFAVDWRMALAAIVVTPVSFVLIVTAMTRGGRRAGAYQAAQQRMNAAIVDYLAGMGVVKIFNRAGESFAATSEAVKNYAKIETEWARDYLPLGGTFFSLVLANIVFILPVGLFLMASGSLDLPTLVFFIILGANYSQPLLKLFNQFHELAHISMGSTLVAEILDTAPQADRRDGPKPTGHDVAFEAVRFGYGKHDVLHGISFTARAGTVTALVGPSGGGKSTIAGLVPRFWDVRSGRVTVGGVDVRDMSLDDLMDTVAFVFQNTFLFSDTIAANIRFGNPGATDTEVEAAAKAARAHEFITALPDGYATRLGAKGTTLSGGERQRIAIARAILKDAPIIVLDEATAFADPDNEAAIQEAIEALTVGRTLIIVAHRLHTISAADAIVVVDRGCVAETGQHENLVAQDGLYARLWADYTAARQQTLRQSASGKV
ncbi:ABC transporter ATP-binding protein [Rhodomicrobium sp.]|uniref:ABC transporter ATP-binding protein n=1 Tax=Rhodomicrobium sp. TaxID=2720632 RepID=UPI0039E55F50